MNVYHKWAGCPQRPKGHVKSPQLEFVRQTWVFAIAKYSGILSHLTSPTKTLFSFFRKCFMSSDFSYTILTMGFGCDGNGSTSIEVSSAMLCSQRAPSFCSRGASFYKWTAFSHAPPPSISSPPNRTSHNEGFDKGERVACGGGEEKGSEGFVSTGERTVHHAGLSSLCQEVSFSCYILTSTTPERKTEGEEFSRRWARRQALPTVVYIL